MKELARSYFVEAKWFNEHHSPLFDEYMSNAKITSASNFLTPTSFFGMDSATIEVFNWISTMPKVLEANTIITRVVDDVATYEVRILN